VPFFFIGGAAFVSGRGEFIEPVKTPEGLCVVLAKPPFPSATAEAFALLDQARADNQSRKTRSLSKEALIKALEGGDPREWPFWNDFLPVFLDSSPEGKALAYQSIMESFYREGASFAGLSGSGSCCFGVFAARETGEKALKTFLARGNYARLTFFLARIAKPVLK
jgi:4-diphosphocytidyl-2-C-methyl-D-erythritol kinase